MKKSYNFIAMLLMVTLIAVGCGKIDPDNNSTDNNTTDNNISEDKDKDEDTIDKEGDNGDSDEQLITFQAEVMDAGDALLVTPDQESSEYKSSDKISVATNNAIIVNQNGEEIFLKDLQAGDIIEITYNGTILESYPAQIGASNIKLIDHNLLIDGYLAIIDDVYQDDEALNYEIEMITFDTTGWTGLSNIEKEIVFAKLKVIYNLEIKEGTFDELAEQGIIDKDNLNFENGVHIKISNMKYDEKDVEITYSIEKWRSGLGAIGADDVSAKYKDGIWNIKKGSMWVS